VIQALRDLGVWPERKKKTFSTTGGLTLEKFAKAKKLDPSFLKRHGVFQRKGNDGPYLVFSHRDLDGSEIKNAVRFRFSMTEKPKSKSGGKPMLYGLWRFPDFKPGGELILVEGESDTLTAWLYDLPAVGIPGKTLLKAIDPVHFEGFHTVYVLQEPGRPGTARRSGVSASRRDRQSPGSPGRVERYF
jgi:hypothetical protein